MTTNDIVSHKINARDFYRKLPIPTINEAWKEPLKLQQLRELRQPYGNSMFTYDVAFVYECICSLVSRYKRREPLSDSEKMYIAERCCEKFKYWSVSDFKCFEDMAVGARIPSCKSGQTEYELVAIDIPSIMGKLEAYDRMRPRADPYACGTVSRTQGSCCERPLTDWHRTHILGGAEHVFASEEECERYWHGFPSPEEIEPIVRRLKSLRFSG